MIQIQALTTFGGTAPRFKDRTDAIWRRVIVVPFNVQIKEESKQDRRLVDPRWWSDSGELPGIFNWAIEGLIRLRQRGHFVEPEECIRAKNQYRRECNPAKEFLQEYCHENSGSKIASNKLYSAYCVCLRASGGHPLGEQQFAKEVRRVFPEVTITEHAQRQPVGSRSRDWIGLTWVDGDPSFGGGSF